jgi:site-specific DNA recombinase
MGFLGRLAGSSVLCTRGETRPSRPLSRSVVHRILRDDYYIGVVTLKGVKREGRHEPIIDPATFERVQQALDGHRASGDRSHKHSHYLKGTLLCACGKRLGFGRHRGKCGGSYEYFSCLSRVQRGGRCPAPYFPVEDTERAVVRRYKRETLTPDERDTIREALRIRPEQDRGRAPQLRAPRPPAARTHRPAAEAPTGVLQRRRR